MEPGRIERVFVDIDTQFDFLDPSGRLYVPGGQEILPALHELFRLADNAKIPVLSTADDHPPDDPEFQQYPPHCLQSTPGQKKLPFTMLSRVLTIQPDGMLYAPPVKILKDHDQAVFTKTAFDAFTNPHFARFIDELDVGEYIVFGVATDICVRAAVEGLLDRNRRVTLIRDATAAVDAAASKTACRQFKKRGMRSIASADLLREVQP